MRVALALVLMTSAAFADGTWLPHARMFHDPTSAIGEDSVEAAVRAPPVATPLARCAHPRDVKLVLWLAFENGKVIVADAGGTSDRKLEACVVAAAKNAMITSKGHVIAVVELVTAEGEAQTQRSASDVLRAYVHADSPSTIDAGVAVVASDAGVAIAASDAAVAPDAATITETGPLSADQISKVVTASAGKFRGCYDVARRDQPDLSGKITYHFEIDATGAVTEARARAVNPPQRLDACIVKTLKALKFPASTGKSAVDYPFAFSSLK